MKVTEQVEIRKERELLWKAITDIENSEGLISSILKINILHRPADSLVGLKWEETREMFGKEAIETMWITDAVTNEYYSTRAESHGSVYITKLSIDDCETGTLLTMSFSGFPQKVGAKIGAFLMLHFIRSSIRKALIKDLEDIKNFVESNG